MVELFTVVAIYAREDIYDYFLPNQ